MSRTGSIISCADPLQNYTSNNLKIGLFRNDSINKKVFYIPVDSTSESLLYDFNLLQGDTIRGYMEDIAKIHFDTTFYAVIDSVDSILVNGSFRKRWRYHTNDFWGLIWGGGEIIEGIGSTYGLLEGLLPMFDDNGILVCYSEYGSSLYGISPCLLVTNVKNTSKIGGVKIYPNPNNGKFTIKLNNTENATIEIYTISGQFILQKIVTKNTIQIDLSNYQKGMYFVKVNTPNGTMVKKIVYQ